MILPNGKDMVMEILRVVITKKPFSTNGIEIFDDFPSCFVKLNREEIEYMDLGYKIIEGEKKK